MKEPIIPDNFSETAGNRQDLIIISRNPVTGEELGRVRQLSLAETPDVMARARAIQPQWAKMSLDARMAIVKKIRDLVFERHQELVDLLCAELGKIPHEARFEILQQLVTINYTLSKIKKLMKTKKPLVWQLPYRVHTIERRPHGVVLLIAPWNFPVVLCLDTAIPALLSGNAVIYKPSEFTSQVGEFLAKIILDAGVPDGVFQIVQGYGETGAALIEQRPDKISFTGSVATGRKIGAKAGELLIPTTLELGGKDAAIVLADADLNRAARGIVWAGMLHAGQMCMSVERVLVIDSVADELIALMREVVRENVKPGTPDDPSATYGPITLEKQMTVIQAQIAQAEARGATIYRDKILDTKLDTLGAHYMAPIILTDVPLDADVWTTETFGPVIVVKRVKDEAEAIQLANDSDYGLTASIWTENRQRGLKLARQLHVGNVGVNDHVTSSSDPHLPWGGVKDTGMGRIRSEEGILSFSVPVAITYDRFRFPIDLFWYPYNRAKKSVVKRLFYLWFGRTWRERFKGLGRLG